MGAKVYADCLSLEPGSGPETPTTDGELEVEVQAIAAWFESLPEEWRSYFDREAQTGRRAYVLA